MGGLQDRGEEKLTGVRGDSDRELRRHDAKGTETGVNRRSVMKNRERQRKAGCVSPATELWLLLLSLHLSGASILSTAQTNHPSLSDPKTNTEPHRKKKQNSGTLVLF